MHPNFNAMRPIMHQIPPQRSVPQPTMQNQNIPNNVNQYNQRLMQEIQQSHPILANIRGPANVYVQNSNHQNQNHHSKQSGNNNNANNTNANASNSGNSANKLNLRSNGNVVRFQEIIKILFFQFVIFIYFYIFF